MSDDFLGLVLAIHEEGAPAGSPSLGIRAAFDADECRLHVRTIAAICRRKWPRAEG